MASDGDARDLKARRDLRGRQPAAQQLENFGLTPRELDGRASGNLHPPAQAARTELVGQRAEQLARDGRLAAPDGLQRATDPRCAAALEDVAGRAGAQRIDQLIRVGPPDEEDGRCRRSTHLHERERGHAFPALAAVNDADVRAQANRSRGGGHAFGGLRRHAESARLEQRADAGANAGRRRDDERLRFGADRFVPGTGDGVGRYLI